MYLRVLPLSNGVVDDAWSTAVISTPAGMLITFSVPVAVTVGPAGFTLTYVAFTVAVPAMFPSMCEADCVGSGTRATSTPGGLTTLQDTCVFEETKPSS